ncbi:MAG: hypothetical protein HZA93_13295 [Verrucomicrobia bacterium]|nr:hypothetical protein [Verrucomicrobiota bacterium]
MSREPDYYDRTAAWSALLGVALFAVIGLMVFPWLRWTLGGLFALWAVKKCVRVRRVG